jgi:hypothetical protein
VAVEAYYKVIEDKIFAKKIGEDFVELPRVENDNNLEFYLSQFLKFEKQVQTVLDKIDATDNKGSYLAKVLLLIDELTILNGIGDFDALNQKLRSYKATLSEQVESNRRRNAEIKTALIESLSKIVEENNWKATEETKEIHQKWLRVGKASEELEESLNLKYETLKTEFFNQKKDFFDTQKELTEARTQYYREIIQQIEELTEAKDLKANRVKVDELVESWKQNGAIPKVSYDTLFSLYKKTLDAYFNKLKKAGKSQGTNKDQNTLILKKKEEVLKSMLDYKQATTRYETKKIHSFKDAWNLAGKVNGRLLGKLGDDFYQNIEFLYEYANLQNFQEKKNYGLDKASLQKTLKRFISENEDEIRIFKENQENMSIQLSNDSVASIFNKRLSDLEKKLKAKKRVLDSFDKQSV